MTSMSMRRRSWVPNVASGRAGSCVLVQPLLHENSTNDAQFCAFRRCLADCPSGKLGVGKQSHQTQHTFATLENGILSVLIVLKRILSHSSAFNSDQEWCRPPCHRFRGIMLLCRLRNITMFIWYHIIVAHYSISTKRRVHRNTTILHLPRWLCKRVSPRHHNSSTHSSSTTIFPLSTRPHSTRCSLPASLLFLHSSEQKHAHRHPSHGTAPLGL